MKRQCQRSGKEAKGEIFLTPVMYGEEAREVLIKNGKSQEDGGCVVHRRTLTIADYGELELWQKPGLCKDTG